MTTIELRDDTLVTSMPAGSWFIGGQTSSDPVPTAYAREAIYNYMVSALASVASSGSASDLSTGTLPLGRLHAHLADIASIASPLQGDILYFNGSDFVALNPGVAGQILTTNGPSSNPTWTNTGVGDLRALNNLSDVDSTVTAVANLRLTSTATGEGAALIGIEDAGGYYAGDTIESALQDLGVTVASLDQVVILKGSWDASAGTFPGAGAAQAGWSYIVTVGGTVDGVVFSADDRIVALADNASTTTYAANWHQLDYTDRVTSVAGRTGAVTLAQADISGLTTADSPTFAGLNGIASIDATTESTIETAIDTLANLTSIQGVGFTMGAYAATLLNTASESAFKAAVNLEIGVDIQAYDADLTAIGALAKTDGNIIVGNGTTWVAEAGATARTSLGLGTGDSPQFAGLTVTGNPLFGGDSGAQNVAIRSTDNQVALVLDGPSGSLRTVNGRTWTGSTGLNRHLVVLGDTTAESGADAGSNGRWTCYDDTGANLGNAFEITRATRVVNFPVGPTVPTAAVGTNTTQAASTAFVRAGYLDGVANIAAYIPSGSGAVTRTLQSKIRDAPANPADYGVAVDGVTVCTAEFQAMLDARLDILLTPGTYLIDDTLELSSHHRIRSAGATIKVVAAPSNSQTLTHWSVLNGTVVDDVHIEGLQFDLSDMTSLPTSATTVRAVQFRRSSNIRVVNNHFNVKSGSISFVGCNKFVVSGNTIQVAGSLGMPDGQIDIWVEYALDSYDFAVCNNIIDGGGYARWGILANSLDFTGIFMEIHDFTVSGNVIRNLIYDGIWTGNLTAGDVSNVAKTYNGAIVGNYFDLVRKGVSLSDCYDVSVSSNNGTNLSGSIVHLFTSWSANSSSPGCSRCAIVGNSAMASITPSGTPIGLWAEMSTNCTIIGNSIRNDTNAYYYYGITLGSGSTGNTIQANAFDNLTTELGNFSGNLTNLMSGVSYTPTYAVVANITGSISNGNAWYIIEGRRVIVYFTVVLEPTASATNTSFTVTLPVSRTANLPSYVANGILWGSSGAGFAQGQIVENSLLVTANFTSINTTSARYMGSFIYTLD